MHFKSLVAACTASLLLGCPQNTQQCEVQPQPSPTDSGSPPVAQAIDSRTREVAHKVRIVNLTSSDLVFQEEGATPEHRIASHKHYAYVVVRAQKLTATYGKNSAGKPKTLSLDISVDVNDEQVFVVRDNTPDGVASGEQSYDIVKLPQRDAKARRPRRRPIIFEEILISSKFSVLGGVDVEGDCNADDPANIGKPAKYSVRDDDSVDCASSADNNFTPPDNVTDEAYPFFVSGDEGLDVAWVEGGIEAGKESGSISLEPVLTGPLQPIYVLNARADNASVEGALAGKQAWKSLKPSSMTSISPSAMRHASKTKGTGESGQRVLSLSVGGVTQEIGLGAKAGVTWDLKWPKSYRLAHVLVLSENADSPVIALSDRATSGLKDTLKTQVRLLRPHIAPTTTLSNQTSACLGMVPGDDNCAAGFSVIPKPTSTNPGILPDIGTRATRPMPVPETQYKELAAPFFIDEAPLGEEPVRRFVWSSPPTEMSGVGKDKPNGFAIIAPGEVFGSDFAAFRTLLYVNTNTSPWSVSEPVKSDGAFR